jgi:glycerol kinase
VELRIDGGMSRSAWFSQRLADLTGVGVCRATYQETTALGAALFAGVGAGVYADVAQAAGARPQTEGYAPTLAAGAREGAYARWLDAVTRVRSS